MSAGTERRFYAFVVDRLLAWGLYAAAAWASYQLLIEPGHLAAGAVVVAAAVLLVEVLMAAGTGRWGLTPGKALAGLRVVSLEDARPVGFRRALLRTAILGAATVPTLGLGAAALAWSAMADPTGRRRGWHDVRTGTVVVDVRPLPVQAEPVEEAPRPVVNVTAMRLVPAPPMSVHPVASPMPTPVRPAPPPRWGVDFDTGERFEVDGLTLVGRGPEPRPGEPVARLVTLRSGDLSLSKTHAQFQVVPDGALVVMDRGSTNGSILLRDGLSRRLAGGRPVTLRGGDRVRFGDREMSVVRLS